MKKFLALLLAVVMVLTMVACGEGKKKADGQVVIGTSTEASGDWAYSAFVRNPNATDKAVMTLTDDMTRLPSRVISTVTMESTRPSLSPTSVSRRRTATLPSSSSSMMA